MNRVTRPIILQARSEYLEDIAEFVNRLGESPNDARIRIELPKPGMHDDRAEVHVSIGNLGIRLPTFRGWVLDDVSPMGIHHVLTELLEHARSHRNDASVHEDAVSRHVRAAMIFARHDESLPEDLTGEIDVEACMDPDGRLVLWVDQGDRHHRVAIDHEEMEAILGHMPIPCHAWQAMNDPNNPVVFIIIGASMSEEEGLEMSLGREDPVETMRMIQRVSEHRSAE